MKPETLSSCMKRLEEIRSERDGLRTRVAELEAAAKLALSTVNNMQDALINCDEALRALKPTGFKKVCIDVNNLAFTLASEAIDALRKAGVK